MASTPTSTTMLPTCKTGLLPTPNDGTTADQRPGSAGTYVANAHVPSIEVTPPANLQPWLSKGVHKSAPGENEEAPRSRTENDGNHDTALDVPPAESRPPSALSLDSGYGGCFRSVSPGSERETVANRYKSAPACARDQENWSFSQDHADAAGSWSIRPQPPTRATYATQDSFRVFSGVAAPRPQPASGAIGSGRTDSYRPPIPHSATTEHQLLQSLSQLSFDGGSKYALPRTSSATSAFSSPSATPAHLRWFDQQSGNDDHYLKTTTAAESVPISFAATTTTHALPCSSSIGLNPYGTQLSFAYADEMDKFISEKFHFSPSARMGKKSESGGAVEGTSDQIRRDSATHVAAKYEWNHWNSGGGFGNLETAPIAFEDLPFAPPSRLTFLRDDPMEVRGANGSNGFDVYVR